MDSVAGLEAARHSFSELHVPDALFKGRAGDFFLSTDCADELHHVKLISMTSASEKTITLQ